MTEPAPVADDSGLGRPRPVNVDLGAELLESPGPAMTDTLVEAWTRAA